MVKLKNICNQVMFLNLTFYFIVLSSTTGKLLVIKNTKVNNKPILYCNRGLALKSITLTYYKII